METFVAVPHRSEITVSYNNDDNIVSIISDDCPSVTDPDQGTWQELRINPEDIPALITALQKAHTHISKTPK